MKSPSFKNSAIFVALFLCAAGPLAASQPLTETLYLVPVSRVEVLLRDETVLASRDFRKDTVSLGVGITSWFSLWVRFDYLTQSTFKIKKADAGDFFIKGKFAIGDFFNDVLHLGFMIDFRFPSGKNAYSNADWRNVALGKNEIKIGPFCRIDIVKLVFIHLNAFYVFREGSNENFYGGFFFDITKEDTWVKAFGFNPTRRDTFFSSKRLNNDYMVTSVSVNTTIFYPIIPHIEIYKSFRITRDRIDTRTVPIECARYDPLLLGAGLRYFFKRRVYLGAYTVQNPFRQAGYIRGIYGLELGMTF